MKKAKPGKRNELRPEYKRSDFGKMVRGKYTNRISTATNVVLLDPEVAEAFPNDEAVNDAQIPEAIDYGHSGFLWG